MTTISDEIGSDMDKTKSREKYINQQLESLITELRTSHDKLAQAKVKNLTKKFSKIFQNFFVLAPNNIFFHPGNL